jgi:tetratricopeptide (TPR) repeat protein
MLDEDFETALPYLEQSVKLNKNFPVSQSNLADVYFSTGQLDNALLAAQQAFGLYTAPQEKAEAARKIAEIYIEKKQGDKAVMYYLKADDLLPNDYLTLMPLLKVEMELNNPDYANRTNQVITLAPDNPAVYQDVYKIYSENEKEKEFIDFLDSQKVYYRSNVRALAHNHFYTAVAQYEQDKWVDAKINFEKARSLFRNIFKSNHSVFKVIDSYTNAIRKK